MPVVPITPGVKVAIDRYLSRTSKPNVNKCLVTFMSSKVKGPIASGVDSLFPSPIIKQFFRLVNFFKLKNSFSSLIRTLFSF